MAAPLTCIVTIHGVGFQQAPAPGIEGYADGLQKRLQSHLPDILGGDPSSEFGRPAGTGAVYVHSDWPVDTRKMEEGLHRLGRWTSDQRTSGSIDATGVPLAQDGFPATHVALVYSHLEDQGPHLGSSLESLGKTVIEHGRYASLLSIAHMGIVDVWAAMRHGGQSTSAQTPSLYVRKDAPSAVGHANAATDPSGLLPVVQQLDHDLATYVCRHDLRARVSDFVHEALLRICCRDDVAHVLVNGHSLGTVVAFDALRTLPPFAANKVKCFVTAGSPLRKFTQLYFWGSDCGPLATIPWRNFWDATDPVADPLVPPAEWRRGSAMPEHPQHPKLFYTYDADTGNEQGVDLTDIETSNAAHAAGGGLPAHNYWDNEAQFVTPLAEYVQTLVSNAPISS